jgi:hypothetical protein
MQSCAAGTGGAGAVVTPVGACNGSGGCTQTPQSPCIYTQCNGNVCATSCTNDAGCITGDYCSSMGGGTCKGRHASGTDCTPDDCQSSPCNFGAQGAGCRASGQCCSGMCNAPSCTNGTMTVPTCASGTCMNPTMSCGGYACNAGGTACLTTCANDNDCDNAYYCASDSTCTMRVGSMGNCADADCKMAPCRECATGLNCNGGKCK